MGMRIIIAEDDPAMRLVLRRVLEEIPGIREIQEVENGKELVWLAEENRPDIVFVDVDMPVINGIEAAKEIFDIDPKIFLVFATAFDCYAQEAFEVYAFDYLLKPFNLHRIRQTVRRIKQLKLEISGNAARLCPAARQAGRSYKLGLQSINGYSFISAQDIIMITRQNRKTIIHMAGGLIQTYEPLHKLEEQLDDENFFRAHKGYIINVNMVQEFTPWGNKTYLVKLANTTETALITLEKAKEFRRKYVLGGDQ